MTTILLQIRRTSRTNEATYNKTISASQFPGATYILLALIIELKILSTLITTEVNSKRAIKNLKII